MNLLNKIVDRKKKRLNFLKTKVPLREIRSRASDVEWPRNFRNALMRDSGPIRLVAEIKKASPLKGVLRQDFNPVTIASIYERKNVDAISVITEEDSSSKYVANEIPESSLIVSETLAKIYLAQGEIKEAIIIYEKLSKKEPSRLEYFSQRISELKSKL